MRLLAVAAGVCLLLSGCSSTVALQPAPDATSVGCASVIVGMPPVIVDAERRNTDAQGTAAWGTPAAVTLRCGVETPQVSTLPCVTVDGVDWLLDDESVEGGRVLTTYGRDPGVQVVTGAAVSANDALEALSEPVAEGTEATDRVCIPTPGGSASPGATP